MLLAFANENENQYIAGIQKSLKIFEIKIDGIQMLYKNFGIWTVYKQKKPYEIIYWPLFVAV